MFRASSCLSSGATTTAVAASGSLSELGDSSAVGRGRAGRPDHDQTPPNTNILVFGEERVGRLLDFPTIGVVERKV